MRGFFWAGNKLKTCFQFTLESAPYFVAFQGGCQISKSFMLGLRSYCLTGVGVRFGVGLMIMPNFVISVLCLFCVCLKFDFIEGFDDDLDLDIDVAHYRNADHEDGQFHKEDLLRFFLPDGTLVCEGKLYGAVDSKISCTIDKKIFKSGPNKMYHAVFTKSVDGEWVELEHSHGILNLELPELVPSSMSETSPEPTSVDSSTHSRPSIKAFLLSLSVNFVEKMRFLRSSFLFLVFELPKFILRKIFPGTGIF